MINYFINRPFLKGMENYEFNEMIFRNNVVSVQKTICLSQGDSFLLCGLFQIKRERITGNYFQQTICAVHTLKKMFLRMELLTTYLFLILYFWMSTLLVRTKATEYIIDIRNLLWSHDRTWWLNVLIETFPMGQHKKTISNLNLFV